MWMQWSRELQSWVLISTWWRGELQVERWTSSCGEVNLKFTSPQFMYKNWSCNHAIAPMRKIFENLRQINWVLEIEGFRDQIFRREFWPQRCTLTEKKFIVLICFVWKCCITNIHDTLWWSHNGSDFQINDSSIVIHLWPWT